MFCPKSQQSSDRGLIMSAHSAFILLTRAISPRSSHHPSSTWYNPLHMVEKYMNHLFIYCFLLILWFRETYNFLSSALSCLSKTAKINVCTHSIGRHSRRVNHFPCCGCHHEIFTWLSPILATRDSAREREKRLPVLYFSATHPGHEA